VCIRDSSCYPEHGQARVREAMAQARVGPMLAERYGQAHAVRTDRQLYDYVQDLKDRHLRQSVPLAKVVFDGKLQVARHALGTHSAISRVQGGKLKSIPPPLPKADVRDVLQFKKRQPAPQLH
jgi:hypothetical protein